MSNPILNTNSISLSGTLDGQAALETIAVPEFQSDLGTLDEVDIAISATITTNATETENSEDSDGTLGYSDVELAADLSNWNDGTLPLESGWEYYYGPNQGGVSYSYTLPYDTSNDAQTSSPGNGGPISLTATGATDELDGRISGSYTITGTMSVSEAYTPYSTAEYMANAAQLAEENAQPGATPYDIADAAVAYIVDLRDTGDSTNTALRDAEYALRGFAGQSAGAPGISTAINQGMFFDTIFNEYGPTALPYYNALKGFIQTAGGDVGGFGTPPASPPGGAAANLLGAQAAKAGISLDDFISNYEDPTVPEVSAQSGQLSSPLTSSASNLINTSPIALNDTYFDYQNASAGSYTYIDPISQPLMEYSIAGGDITGVVIPVQAGITSMMLIVANGVDIDVDPGTPIEFSDYGIQDPVSTVSVIGAPGGLSNFEVGFQTDSTNEVLVGEFTQVACYCRGTHIASRASDTPVEELRVGDLVTTLSGNCRPIRWIGRRSYFGRLLIANVNVQPVRFAACSLGDGLPRRDLLVSPEHAMFLDGLLIPAWCLVNGRSIKRESGLTRVDYFHIELDAHDVLLAEGAPSESYFDDDNRRMFHNIAEFAALYPDGADVGRCCAPRVTDGYELEAIRQRLGGVLEEIAKAA